MSSWKHSEVAVWVSGMLREEVPHLLSLLLLIAEAAYQKGVSSLSSTALVPLAATVALFAGVRRTKTTKRRFVVVFTYYQFIQTGLIAKNLFGKLNPFDICVSAVLMVQYELTAMHSPFVNILIIAKNTIAWNVVLSQYVEISVKNLDYFLGLFWGVFHLFNYLVVRRDSLLGGLEIMKNLRREQQRLESLLQAIPDGVAVVTECREVVAFNMSLLQQLGVAGSKQPHQDIYKVLLNMQYLPEYTESHSSSSPLTDILAFINRKNANEDSIGVVSLSGVIYELRGRYSKWDQINACVLIVRDITHWVELERKAQRESASKTALLRSVSHELRTPTNVILNLVREIRETELLSSKGVSSLEMITSSTTFLLSIINDLLDYSRIITGNFKLMKQPCHLQQVVKECVSLLQHQCSIKGVELKLFYDPLLPKTGVTDQNRLKQVLLNLLSNAVKFTMKGSIEVSAMLNHRGMMTVRVRDSGIGIPAADQGRIFRLFGKLEGHDNLNPQGCGLGLSISNHIVESLSSSHITVTSTPGRGSTFAFDVNIGLSVIDCPDTIGDKTTDISDDEDVDVQSPVYTFHEKKKQRSAILIVDDSDFNRVVARKMIEARGLECDEATTGLQALRKVKEKATTGTPYRVILMDVEMPEMDGITATREIRSFSEIVSQPGIIGCSAYSSPEDRELSLSAGMDHYLEKPMNREQLYNLLSSFAL